MGAPRRGGTPSPASGQGVLVFEGQEGPGGGRAGGAQSSSHRPAAPGEAGIRLPITGTIRAQ